MVRLFEFSDPHPGSPQRIRVAQLTSTAAAMHITAAVSAMSSVAWLLAFQAGWPGSKVIFDRREHLKTILQALLDLAGATV